MYEKKEMKYCLSLNSAKGIKVFSITDKFIQFNYFVLDVKCLFCD